MVNRPVYTDIPARSVEPEPQQQGSSMVDNPIYDQAKPGHSPEPQQQESSVSNSHSPDVSGTSTAQVEPEIDTAPNPVYGIIASSPTSHRPTIRRVLNPVYGDPSDISTDGNVYSPAPQSPVQSNADNNGHLYAMIETSVSCATSRTTQENVNLQSTEAQVEHEYDMVDKSTQKQNVTTAPYGNGVPPYI